MKKIKLITENDVTTVTDLQNKALTCPFKAGQAAAMPPKLQGQAPAITFFNQECNSLCPHFSIDENSSINYLKLTCTNVILLSIEEDKQQLKKI